MIFFVLTFFSIGVLSNFRRLWEDGLGRLAAVYVVSLFGFVIWVGLLISWLFFGGLTPPLVPAEHRRERSPMPNPDLRAELARPPVEPLLPIEKKLIGWSLGLGLTLLVLLALMNRFLPVGS